MINEYSYSTPIGELWIAEEDGAIVKISIEAGRYDSYAENSLIKEAHRQIAEYFERKRTSFDFPVKLCGTKFQEEVWKALCEIPHGETRCYGDVAKSIGNPNAARAVGGAVNKNKLLIVVPCHRVIGANGDLVGFAAGMSVKKYLLEIEKTR